MDTDIERGTTPELSNYYQRRLTVPDIQQVEGEQHDIEKGARANVFSGKMIQKLEQVSREFRKNYIYKVADVIRKGNENHYEPILFSIGPYHRGKTKLQPMEEHKWQCLNGTIQRVMERTGISRSDLMNKCYQMLEGLEDEARGYYSDDTTGLNSDEFLEMLLLDGCFLIDILNKIIGQNGEDPLLNTLHVEVILQHDVLFLLENQLPFFILEKLNDLMVITDNPRDGLLLSAIKNNVVFVFQAIRPTARCLKDYVSSVFSAYKLYGNDEDASNMILSLPDLGLQVKGKEVYPDELRYTKHLFELFYKVLLKEDIVNVTVITSNTTTEEDKFNMEYVIHTFSVTELSNAGVKFKHVDKEKFYDIQFKNGVLEIPTIGITRNTTEGVFRNLIAYEKGNIDIRGIINDYVCFMDSLINSEKDVELLRIHGIIEHFLGDDEAVSTMFNNLGTTAERSSDYYYSDIVRQLKRHCRKRRNRWMAKLKSDYFSSPWTIISVIAAFILLVLTVISTVYSPLSYYNG